MPTPTKPSKLRPSKSKSLSLRRALNIYTAAGNAQSDTQSVRSASSAESKRSLSSKISGNKPISLTSSPRESRIDSVNRIYKSTKKTDMGYNSARRNIVMSPVCSNAKKNNGFLFSNYQIASFEVPAISDNYYDSSVVTVDDADEYSLLSEENQFLHLAFPRESKFNYNNRNGNNKHSSIEADKRIKSTKLIRYNQPYRIQHNDTTAISHNNGSDNIRLRMRCTGTSSSSSQSHPSSNITEQQVDEIISTPSIDAQQQRQYEDRKDDCLIMERGDNVLSNCGSELTEPSRVSLEDILNVTLDVVEEEVFHSLLASCLTVSMKSNIGTSCNSLYSRPGSAQSRRGFRCGKYREGDEHGQQRQQQYSRNKNIRNQSVASFAFDTSRTAAGKTTCVDNTNSVRSHKLQTTSAACDIVVDGSNRDNNQGQSLTPSSDYLRALAQQMLHNVAPHSKIDANTPVSFVPLVVPPASRHSLLQFDKNSNNGNNTNNDVSSALNRRSMYANQLRTSNGLSASIPVQDTTTNAQLIIMKDKYKYSNKDQTPLPYIKQLLYDLQMRVNAHHSCGDSTSETAVAEGSSRPTSKYLSYHDTNTDNNVENVIGQ